MVLHHYTYADDAGIYETIFELGSKVDRGQVIGYLHFADRIDRPPAVCSG